jgi:hypothetical protein
MSGPTAAALRVWSIAVLVHCRGLRSVGHELTDSAERLPESRPLAGIVHLRGKRSLSRRIGECCPARADPPAAIVPARRDSSWWLLLPQQQRTVTGLVEISVLDQDPCRVRSCIDPGLGLPRACESGPSLGSTPAGSSAQQAGAGGWSAAYMYRTTMLVCPTADTGFPSSRHLCRPQRPPPE